MRVRHRNPLLAPRRFWLALAAAAAIVVPSAARADENLLHGPHPFLRDNQLSLHILIGQGMGDTLSGAKLALDYGYKLTDSVVAPVWLSLQVNYEHAGCTAAANSGVCGTNSGDVIETLAGARWTFATPIPLVPFLESAAGLLFAFPNGATDAVGLGVRFVGGANYFFFDWLGLGAQVGFSVGHIGYDATFAGSHNYAVLDFGGGLEFQF
jgi:hypothetical protein